MGQPQRPVLIYAADSPLRAWQVRYWQRLTGNAVDYLACQEIADRYPDISPAECRRSIQLVTPQGQRYTGAVAAARVLSHGGRHAAWRCHRYLPGYARIAGYLHALVARHPNAAYWFARLLWGRERYPAQYQRVSWLFLRLLALVYLAAFASFGLQAEGLVGSQGILPVAADLRAISEDYGGRGYWLFPSVFWLNASNVALQFVSLAGVGAALLLFGNILTRLMLPLLFVLYLSVVFAGQVFFNFQWDFMLLEAGFLAIFLPWGSPLVIWLFHWLLFRVRFLSGISKLLSGDPAWANFTALDYYFETQPLPHVGSWLAHQLPEWMLRTGVGWVFFVELLVPFLVFLPRRPRLFAAWTTILTQVLIMLTSNHNFFNLLTIVVCLLLFDDRDLRWLRLPKMLTGFGWFSRGLPLPAAGGPGRVATACAGLLTVLIVSSTLSMMWSTLSKRPLPTVNEVVVRGLVQWHLVNNYHVFPVMTTQRPEMIIEGSNDGVTWQAYGFRYKPGELTRRPVFNIPHQPRLDWQMWFAALAPPYTRVSYWVPDFIQRLLEGSPDVLDLLEHNPFPGQPPRYVRARLELYRFTTQAEKKATGQWWTSEPIGLYLPPRSL
ncbi:MAG: lipase maturation factor family protein [Gammaproteobacteria bacterium]|nr:lipase maturation factor family protein [Gammaproteobacteria bacterium]